VTFFRQVGWVLGKDLLLEWRSPARLTGVLFFAFAILLMVAFASNTNEVLRLQAAGTLWLGLLLASTRSLDQSFAAEMNNGSLEGLVLWPVAPAALFLGKALANALVLIVVGFAMVPLSIALYNVTITGSPWELAASIVLGCGALAAPGTLMGVITAQARGSSVLLPLLMFPLVVPALLAAARGTTLVYLPDAMDQSTAWLTALVAFNCIHWPLAGLLFGRVAEGGSN